jgi:hypothetical protein
MRARLERILLRELGLDLAVKLPGHGRQRSAPPERKPQPRIGPLSAARAQQPTTPAERVVQVPSQAGALARHE